jgi:hypothetical protein
MISVRTMKARMATRGSVSDSDLQQPNRRSAMTFMALPTTVSATSEGHKSQSGFGGRWGHTRGQAKGRLYIRPASSCSSGSPLVAAPAFSRILTLHVTGLE